MKDELTVTMAATIRYNLYFIYFYYQMFTSHQLYLSNYLISIAETIINCHPLELGDLTDTV